MRELMTILGTNSIFFVIFAIILGLLDLIFVLIINTKYSRLKRLYKKVIRELQTRDVVDILSDDIKKNEEFTKMLNDFRRQLALIDNEVKSSIKKLGIVRYNAFNDVGSDLSFSIAFLDSDDNGVVISGIYGRNETATFAKPITNGQSNYPLSAEEIQAIEKAKKASL